MRKIMLFFVLMPVLSFAQIQVGGTPFALKKRINLFEINKFVLSDYDKKILLLEDERQKQIKPYAFAKGYDVVVKFNAKPDFNTKKYDIYYQKIIVPNANGISLIFSDFYLQKDEKIFIFDNSKKYLIGALTEINNKKSGILPVRFLPVDTIIIEYQRLKTNYGKFPYISTIAGAYRDLKDGSEDCEINIACEQDTLWQTIKRAVAKVVYKEDKSKSYYTCTGTMLANTKLDDTPYYLTANHCINSETEAQSAVFYFNYEADSCDGTYGPENHTIAGASLLATADDHLDFALLELSVVPPKIYEPYYAGWDRIQEYSDTSVCIHHPAGDIKKISKDYDTLGISSFSGYDGHKHWQVKEWDQGTTEGGSSGSGLFTTEGLLIGTLSGGEASCDYNYNDLFCQFYHEWDDYNPSDEQLKAWLDTFKFDPLKMYGYDPYLNVELPKPLNLTVFQDSQFVEIIWEEPQNKPDKYLIYRNLQKIAEVDEFVSVNDTLSETGVYVYFATAVFDGKESKPSNMQSIVFGDTSATPKITEIVIYPNPADDEINILTPDTIPIVEIEIYNQLGSLVKIFDFDNKNFVNINISDLPKACYFIRIYTTRDIYYKKMIVF